MKNTERLYQQIANSEGCHLITIDGKPYGVLGATINHEPRGSIELEVMDAIVPQWNGTGRPPAGTVCNMRISDGRAKPAEILGHGKTRVFIREINNGEEWSPRLESVSFSAIRTPEQVAADEREAAIDEMWRVYWQPGTPTAKQALGLLWDAGYRKQSTKQDDQ